MTDDDVLAAFAKLPLPQKMRAFLETTVPQIDERAGHRPYVMDWPELADRWEAEDAKAADQECIAEELGRILECVVEESMRVLASAVGAGPDGGWHAEPNWYTDQARVLLERFPHIAEGWPTDD